MWRLNAKVNPTNLVEDAGNKAIPDKHSYEVTFLAEHLEELRHRLAEHRTDPMSAVSWREVRAKLFSR